MRDIGLKTIAALLCLGFASVVHAQQSQPSATVPKLVRFSGSFHPANGMTAQPVESVTLSVYSDQVGGAALWQETQNIAVDGEGKYSALMGATQNDGVPMELFASGEPRWLGAQFNRPGEPEQPRVLMASVPYALKSVDAETLGGKPASAYLLAGAPASAGIASSVSSNTGAAASTGATATTVMTNTTTVKPRTISGSQGFIPVFTDATNDLGNSVMQQSNGNIGVGTVPGANANTTPSLDLRTAPFSQIGMAQTTDYLTFFASDAYGPAIYWNPGHDLRFGKGGTSLYNAFGFTEQMRIQSSTGNVGIGTQTPGSRLDVAGDINWNGMLRWGGAPFLQNAVNYGIALGGLALGGASQSGSSGGYNTALGFGALASNTFAGYNTATGYEALYSNVNGSENTASGAQALYSNASGQENTASGYNALGLNTTGSFNTAVGYGALNPNTTGSNNIAIGWDAGLHVSGTNSNNIYIGHPGLLNDSGVIRIGGIAVQTAFFVEGVRGVTTGSNDAIPLLIDSSGQLGTVSSSRRYKEDIEDMGEASHDLMRLRPVTFRYKKPFADGSKPVQYGLIAEEVDEVYPDLVAHSADGQIETVKYQVLPAMLLNEVQKQNQRALLQDETIRQQQEQVLQQREQIRKLEERLAALEAVLLGKSSAATAGR